VVVTRQFGERGVRDPLGHAAALANRNDEVSRPVQHQRRDVDRRQDRFAVDAVPDLHEGPSRAGAHAGSQQAEVRRDSLVVPLQAGGPEGDPDALGPPFPLHAIECGLGRVGDPGEQSGGWLQPREGSVEHERQGPFGIRCGEQAARRTSLKGPEQDGALGARSVHDGQDVLHALLQRREGIWRDPIGKARAPPVEEDQAAEGGEPPKEPRELGHVPCQVEMGDPAGGQDDVHRSFPHHLVRDAEASALRVSDARAPMLLPLDRHSCHRRSRRPVPPRQGPARARCSG
jgi:hypothetical protein